MKIALIMENSQAAKSALVESTLAQGRGTDGPRGRQLRHVRRR